VNFSYSECATLADNVGGEIDFEMGRANAGAELDDHVRGIGTEAINHFPDCIRDNSELGAFAPGMNQTDRWRLWIDNVNRAAVGNVNAQCDTPLICDEAVAAAKFTAHRTVATAIDHCDLISVSLFGGEQRPIADADRVADFAMRGLEPLQHLGFIMRNIDAQNSLRENVTTDSKRAQRGKLVEGQVHDFKFQIPSSNAALQLSS
jgi:hypothetical protein